MTSLAQYEKIRVLDTGTHGQVRLVERISDRKQFAMKVATVSDADETRLDEEETRQLQDSYNQYLQEAFIVRNLQDSSIIATETSFSDYEVDDSGSKNQVVCIVMEYADGGSLKQRIEERRSKQQSFSEYEIFEIAVSVLQALRYAYTSHNLAHRDVKPANILFCQGQAKLADFGECKKMKDEAQRHQTIRGTQSYMAPEISNEHVRGERLAYYGPKADVFSAGLVCLDMATLKRPQQRDAATLEGLIATAGDKYSVDFARWLTKMLAQDPKDRPSISDAYEEALIHKNGLTVVQTQSGTTPAGPSNIVNHDVAACAEMDAVMLKYEAGDRQSDEGICRVANLMRQFPDSTDVQRDGCDVFRAICNCGNDYAKTIVSVGAIDLAIKAMNAFPKDMEIQSSACQLLYAMCLKHDDNVAEIKRASGGIKALCAAMRNFGSNEELQTVSCSMLDMLCNLPQCKGFIVAESGISSVVAAMRGFPVCELLQLRACCILAKLANKNSTMRTSIADEGGLSLLLAAMRAFPFSEKLQARACAAVGAASASKRCKIAFLAEGALPTIVSALRTFPASVEVRTTSLLALKVLSDYDFQLASLPLSGEDRSLVDRALEAEQARKLEACSIM